MESGGRIRTQRGWFSGVAAVCNGSVVCLLLLWPLLHIASLPKQTLSVLLAVPAAPAQPLVPMARAVNAAPAATLVNPFSPPRIVPNSIATIDREPPARPPPSGPLQGFNMQPRRLAPPARGVPVMADASVVSRFALSMDESSALSG